MSEQLAPAEVVKNCLETPSEAAWEEFVRCFHPDIAATISYVVRYYRHSDLSLIDDLIQETYLRFCRDDRRLLQTVRHWEGPAIRAYLKRTAESIARDHFRSSMAQKRGGGQADEVLEIEPASGNTSPEDLTLLSEIERLLEEKVKRPRDLAIYRMVRVQGFSAREIAALPQVGLSVKGVESCLFRIDDLLRRTLASKKIEDTGGEITLGNSSRRIR